MATPQIPKALFDETIEGNFEITVSGSRIVAKTPVGNSTVVRTNDKSYFGGDDRDVTRNVPEILDKELYKIYLIHILD